MHVTVPLALSRYHSCMCRHSNPQWYLKAHLYEEKLSTLLQLKLEAFRSCPCQYFSLVVLLINSKMFKVHKDKDEALAT